MAASLQRRSFLRLVGGVGLMAGGAAAVSGCSTAVPEEAIAAWRGPQGQDDPRDPRDLRRWVLAHAILAPHSHNLQSWLVDLRTPGEITLRVDLQRLLPETDPFSRQIMMSQGTFLELLDIAARERGQRAQITLFPEGAFGPQQLDSRPVARIRLEADSSVARDPLFAQVFQRRTNRAPYEPTRAVPAAAWQAMTAAALAPGLGISQVGHVGLDQPQALARHRELANEAWRIELITPHTMLESIKLLRVGPREIAQHRDGISLMSPMLRALDALGQFDRTRAPAADSTATKGQIEGFAKAIASTPGFVWMPTRGNDRATQVNAGRAYARLQLAATAAGLAMQPLSQALQEYPEMAGPYAEVHRLVQAPQPEFTVQMWARVGYAAPVPPAPRRGLEAHIVSG